MKRSDLIFLARLRLLVGYLGEQNQFDWWSCSFFSPSSKAFLVPVCYCQPNMPGDSRC
jgi:hypothetical protein